MKCSFLEPLIFFWLALVGIYCWEFISHDIKETFYINTITQKTMKKNKYYMFFMK